MNEQTIRFRLGIFVLASLMLLAVLITLFGGFPSYFKKSEPYYIVFDDAGGLAPGTPVRRSGVRIGEVHQVRLNDDTGKVDVTIQVGEDFTVRKADRATIVRGLIGGDTAIALVAPEGQKDAEPLPPGGVLKGADQADMRAIVQKTGELMPVAQETMVEMKKVFERLDKMMPLFEETVKEFREVGKVTKEMIPELRKTNDEVRELVKTTRTTVPDLKRTNDEVQLTVRQWGKVGERVDLMLQTNEDKVAKALDRLQDTLKRVGDVLSDENQRSVRDILKNAKAGSDRLDSIVKSTEDLLKESGVTMKRVTESLARADDVLANMQKATKPFAERSPAILKNIDESTDKLNRTLTDLRDVFQAVARGDGSLQKLLTDPSLYNNVNDSAAMVTKILPRLDRILRDIETFADKLARHPELIGVGGAIRPSSGLKESPSVIYPWKQH